MGIFGGQEEASPLPQKGIALSCRGGGLVDEKDVTAIDGLGYAAQ